MHKSNPMPGRQQKPQISVALSHSMQKMKSPTSRHAHELIFNQPNQQLR